jgi:hypothetical protein
MTLKKPSEIDLELDRLQADLDRCGAEQRALDAQKQAIKDNMTAALLKNLLKERIFRQREWRLLFWYDGTYRLQVYPQPVTWDEIDTLMDAAGASRRILIPLPGGITVPFRLTCDREYGFELPDADQVVRVVQGLGLTVVGLGALEDEVQRQQAVLDLKRAALDQFRQAFGERGE